MIIAVADYEHAAGTASGRPHFYEIAKCGRWPSAKPFCDCAHAYIRIDDGIHRHDDIEYILFASDAERWRCSPRP
jgi:CDGSH-type Zn-finger protein